MSTCTLRTTSSTTSSTTSTTSMCCALCLHELLVQIQVQALFAQQVAAAAFQCFVQSCMEASSTWEFCACVQAGLFQTLLHHIVDPLVCLVHSYLERLSPLLGRLPGWRTWYKFVDGPPTSESFFPSWAGNNKRHCQTYLSYRGIKKLMFLQDLGMTVGTTSSHIYYKEYGACQYQSVP